MHPPMSQTTAADDDAHAFDAHARFEPLAPAARRAMRLSAVLGALALAVAIAVPSSLALVFRGQMQAGTWLALLAGLALVLATASWLLAGARWRRTHWRLDQDGLTIRRGLVWRSETLVPRSRVQHVDLGHGPLDRHFGLAGLKIHTAGTRLAAVTLDGLERARAEALRDALVVQDEAEEGVSAGADAAPDQEPVRGD